MTTEVRQGAGEGIRWHFDVDVVGGRNLRCPSCPVGNSEDVRQPGGHMAPGLLDRIVAKARSECRLRRVALYNWTEPFLHPDLPAMIRAVHGHGVRCVVSTNLNIVRRLDEVLADGPETLRISLSGFGQETYGTTHSRGDIETVKRNMLAVARSRARTHSRTRVVVAFHRYLGNHEDEARMRAYAESLAFDFAPVWAYFMPLEKLMAYAEPDATDVTLDDGDRALIARLALPLDAALELSRAARSQPCKLRERQMALTFQGKVMLCCSVYDQEKYVLGDFLETPMAELQARKHRHAQCGSCMRNGIHALGAYAVDELDAVALANVRRHHPEARLLGMREEGRRASRHGVAGWPRKVRHGVRGLMARYRSPARAAPGRPAPGRSAIRPPAPGSRSPRGPRGGPPPFPR